jgi:hypothetical protein
MLNEILPLSEPINFSSSSNDLLNFKFYRNSASSNRITLTLNNNYSDLPNAVAPVGPATAEYIITLKNNIIQYSNVTTPLFKLGGSGLFKYDIEFECYASDVGKVGILLTNAANVAYKNDVILIKDITTASTSIKFSALLYHAANDFAKLRFTGVKNGGGLINLNISYINLYIEKK